MFTASKAAGKPEAVFLNIVWSGLEHIYKAVKALEAERISGMGMTPERVRDFSYCSFGSEPGDDLVCNYFLWYASACYNFIQVFSKAFSPAEKLDAEFGNIITWRHKVSAHPSWVWPKGDSMASQQMSICLFPEFSDGHFQVGGVVICSPTHGQSCDEWCWCLVK